MSANTDRNGIKKLNAASTKPVTTAHKIDTPKPKGFTPPSAPANPQPKLVQRGELLRVAANSNPASVAGAIAGIIREKGKCDMQAVGAGAVNQAVKAVAIARGYLAPQGYDLWVVPAFIDIEMQGEERTAIAFAIEPRRHA